MFSIIPQIGYTRYSCSEKDKKEYRKIGSANTERLLCLNVLFFDILSAVVVVCGNAMWERLFEVKFVSTSGHAMFCFLYRFPNFSEDF